MAKIKIYDAGYMPLEEFSRSINDHQISIDSWDTELFDIWQRDRVGWKHYEIDIRRLGFDLTKLKVHDDAYIPNPTKEHDLYFVDCTPFSPKGTVKQVQNLPKHKTYLYNQISSNEDPFVGEPCKNYVLRELGFNVVGKRGNFENIDEILKSIQLNGGV